jgi:hypothetical protein
MADDLTFQSATPATVPEGTVAATDESGGKHYQIVELADATTPTQRLGVDSGGRVTVKISDGTDVLGVNADGSINVSGTVTSSTSIVHLSVTPTISTGIYAAKDAIGGLLTFANAASSSGRPIMVSSASLIDKDQERAEIDLVLFKASIGAPTDNAVFDPTDAELIECVGVIQFNIVDYADFSDNCVAVRYGLGLDIDLDGTDLYGALVARSTPTYTATNDIVVSLRIVQY